MLRINIFLFLSILLYSSFASAQSDEERRLHQLEFTNYLDSLNAEDRFDLIIDTCSKKTPDYIDRIKRFNLIGAYFFLGDTSRSQLLMNEAVAQHREGSLYIQNLLSIDDAVYKRYLLKSNMKTVILDTIYARYKHESHHEEILGLELMHLIVHDQWIRYSSDVYNKLKPDRKYLHKTGMDSLVFMSLQKLHTDTVYAFYQKTQKIMSKNEVGDLAFRQSALLFHEWDLERREFYYLLVKKAVEQGDFSIELLMNFEAGTQYIILGIEEYIKRREAIQNDLRLKYNQPDYHIRLV